MSIKYIAAFAALAAMSESALPVAADAAASAAPGAVAATVAKPVLAYTNLGFGGSFGSGYYFISGPVNHAGTYAAPFVAGVSGQLDHIDLPLHGGPVVVSIYPDANGVPGTYDDGSPLEEWLDTKFPSGPAALKPIKFVSKAHPVLTAGTTYWVVVAPLFYDSTTSWNLNSTNVLGVDATFQGAWTNTWAPYTANNSVTPALDVWVH
jgi:hypothetical protein